MLLILRHVESTKNYRKQFSSLEDDEELTSDGLCMGHEVAENIATFIDVNSFDVKKIYCANSARAIETAKIIADKLGVKICAFNDLCSNNSGALRGKSESEAQVINPMFMKQLKLFRAGIYSSYDFVNVTNREDKRDFETRVNLCLENILTQDIGSLKIVVLHHSSLTAAIIYVARKFYNYPKEFYGHVACSLGHVYLIDDDFLLCNEPASSLKEIELL